MRSQKKSKQKPTTRNIPDSNNLQAFRDFKDNDIIIPVMGISGAGKSTFINVLLGNDRMKVGHELTSCTNTIEWEVVDPTLITNVCPQLETRRVILVDTPGFDDTYRSESETLRCIGDWLASPRCKSIKVGGVIYLQNIAETRVNSTNRRIMSMFEKLCGQNALERVVLATTRWQIVDEEVGALREERLSEGFWKDMIELGSQVMRFDLQRSSALRILETILFRFVAPPSEPRLTPVRGQRQGHHPDIVILVVGRGGVGKSTFINTLLGRETMRVNHDLTSDSSASIQAEYVDPKIVAQIHASQGDNRVVIVDTPGFEQTLLCESVVLQRVYAWFTSSYPSDTKLGGVIYLENILDNRQASVSYCHLKNFQQLCGASDYSRIVLATSGWQAVKPEIGARREKSLKDIFWKPMSDGGSPVMRFELEQASALQILNTIIHRIPDPSQAKQQPTTALRIQEELAGREKHISQTEAGRQLTYSPDEAEEILQIFRQTQTEHDEELEKLRGRVQALERETNDMCPSPFTRMS